MNNLEMEIKSEIIKERKKYSCQICEINEAVVKLESGSLGINGNFCQPCAIVRLEKWSSWNEELEKKIRMERGLGLMVAERSLEK